jgi:hypothetical protein
MANRRTLSDIGRIGTAKRTVSTVIDDIAGMQGVDYLENAATGSPYAMSLKECYRNGATSYRASSWLVAAKKFIFFHHCVTKQVLN